MHLAFFNLSLEMQVNRKALLNLALALFLIGLLRVMVALASLPLESRLLP
jgi:hypothetical protein